MEIEVNEQIQQLQEQVHEVAHEIHKQQEKQSHESHWIGQVAVSTGIFAGLAAIAAMQGNFLAEEGMINQIKAADNWAWYQAKSTKSQIQQSSQAVLQSMGKPIPASLAEKADQLDQDQKTLRQKAERLQAESESNFASYELFVYCVAALQVAISLASLATLMKIPKLWYMSLGLAVLGVGFMICGSIPGITQGSSHSTPATVSGEH